MWTWLLIGTCVAAVPAIAVTIDLKARYLVYGVLGTVLIALAPYLLAVVGSAERLLWTLLLLSLQLEVAFTPVLAVGGKVAGPYGIMISPTLLCGFALVALAAGQAWTHRKRFHLDHNIVCAAGAFICTAMLSFVNAAGNGLMLSCFGLFEILSLTLIALVASHTCAVRRNISVLHSAFFTAIFMQSAMLIVEQFLGIQFSLARGLDPDYVWGGTEGRFAGTFGAPSCAATFLVVCLLFLLTRLTSRQPPSRLAFLWTLFALGFLALLLTRTRSAWIGFAIGSLGISWRSYRDGTLSTRVASRLIVGGLLALLLAWPLVAQRLSADHEGAAQLRGNLAWTAVTMITAHPFVGVGINTATNQVSGYARQAGLAHGWIYIVHNQFLLIAAETGLPGLAAFLALAWIGLRSAGQCMRSDDDHIKETGGALFWSLSAMVWALNIDHVSGTMTYALFWFLIGAACGLDRMRQRPQGLVATASGPPEPGILVA